MTAKITVDATGNLVTLGTAEEDALQIDATAKTIKTLSLYSFLPLTNYANDTAAAAAGGGAVGGLYNTAGAVKVRLV
jgi:hypothetical protein